MRKRQLPERPEPIEPVNDRKKMIAGKLTRLAGEANGAIGDQDLGLADPAGIEDDLARRRVACGILVSQAKVERAEGDPAGLAAPSHMDQPLPIRQQRLEPGAGLGTGGPLVPG